MAITGIVKNVYPMGFVVRIDSPEDVRECLQKIPGEKQTPSIAYASGAVETPYVHGGRRYLTLAALEVTCPPTSWSQKMLVRYFGDQFARTRWVLMEPELQRQIVGTVVSKEAIIDTLRPKLLGKKVTMEPRDPAEAAWFHAWAAYPGVENSPSPRKGNNNRRVLRRSGPVIQKCEIV